MDHHNNKEMNVNNEDGFKARVMQKLHIFNSNKKKRVNKVLSKSLLPASLQSQFSYSQRAHLDGLQNAAKLCENRRNN